MRMTASRTRAFAVGSIEVVAAVLTVMPHRQKSYAQFCTLRDRTPRALAKDLLKTVEIETAPAADHDVNAQNPTGGIAVSSLVRNVQDLVGDFVLVHFPPRRNTGSDERSGPCEEPRLGVGPHNP